MEPGIGKKLFDKISRIHLPPHVCNPLLKKTNEGAQILAVFALFEVQCSQNTTELFLK